MPFASSPPGIRNVTVGGVAVTPRSTIDYQGAGVTLVDDPAGGRTTATIASTGGGTWGSSTSGVVDVYGDSGADPTGVADATTQIQAAINAAGLFGAIRFPSGATFLVDSLVVDPTKQQRFYCDGWCTIKRRVLGATAPLMLLSTTTGTIPSAAFLNIDGLIFDGRDNLSDGIHLVNQAYVRAGRLWFKNCRYGIYGQSSLVCFFDDLYGDSCTNLLRFVSLGAGQVQANVVKVRRGVAKSCNTGFYHADGGHFAVDRVRFESCGTGVDVGETFVAGPSTTQDGAISIRDCAFDTCTTPIRVRASAPMTVIQRTYATDPGPITIDAGRTTATIIEHHRFQRSGASSNPWLVNGSGSHAVRAYQCQVSGAGVTHAGSGFTITDAL